LVRNLRQLGLDRGFSQEDLAAAAKTRQALVSAIEIGTANPTLDSLEKLATTLGVSLGDFLNKTSVHADRSRLPLLCFN